MTPQHRMPVARLRELLAELKDDDVLVPNLTANLAIERDGEYVGFVDFCEGVHGVHIRTSAEHRDEGESWNTPS